MKIQFTTNAGFSSGSISISDKVSTQDTQTIDLIIDKINKALESEISEDGVEEFANAVNSSEFSQ